MGNYLMFRRMGVFVRSKKLILSNEFVKHEKLKHFVDTLLYTRFLP